VGVKDDGKKNNPRATKTVTAITIFYV